VKLAAALAILAAAGAITVGVLGIISSHDTSPDEVESCVKDAGGNVILGQEGLAFARTDIERGTLRRAREYRLGDDRGVLLEGDGYRVLVVGIASGPSLAGSGLPLRLYTDTASFATVATERDPLRGVLDRCARRAAH
jgi:hypothetical protein